MDDEVELISDGDGLAVVGLPSAVERFMASVGLSDGGGPLRVSALQTGASVAQAGSHIAANSGRWLKLTDDSARKIKELGGLTPTGKSGIDYAMVGKRGDIKSWIKVAQTPGSMVTNPAVLTGVAGVMAQMAMQQQMAAIEDYLQAIDAKLDAVLRAQTNQALARLDGVDLAVREAMAVRAAVGRVSEVTWSKVQSSAQAIHETQGYALRQLSDLADELDTNARIDELVDVAKDAETEVQKWLLVLARCFELHDAVGVLELDRVLDASPDELDRHRVGLRSARADRLYLVLERTGHLLDRMRAAVELANSKVLFNPKQSPAVVRSSNHVAAEIHEFHEILGIDSGHRASETRAWGDAAAEGWDKALSTGAQGIDGVRRLGGEARGRVGSMKGKLSDRIASRKARSDEDDERE